MRKSVLVLLVMLGFSVAGCGVHRLNAAESFTAGVPGPVAGVDVGFFFDYLSPYGTWVEFSPWGYVWCPTDVGIGWHPFTYGQWLWTDDGWLWDSYYEWGWCPFHYGRWGWDEHLGWFWVPGTVWSPAWVTWRWNDTYVGWAPLPPGVEFRMGIGISGLPEIPFRFWCFADGRHFLDHDLDRYVLPFERNRALLDVAINRGNISFEGGKIFNPGVRTEELRRWGEANVARHRIEDAERPGERRVESHAIRLFRPPVAASEGARPRVFLPREEAIRRVPEMRVEGRDGAASPPERQFEEMLKQRQERETQLMRQSHEQEQTQLRQRNEEEMRRAASQAERQRLSREFQQRNEELQRRQNQERDQMMQRHREEQSRTQRSRPGRGRP